MSVCEDQGFPSHSNMPKWCKSTSNQVKKIYQAFWKCKLLALVLVGSDSINECIRSLVVPNILLYVGDESWHLVITVYQMLETQIYMNKTMAVSQQKEPR